MGLAGNIRVRTTREDFYPTPREYVEDILERETLVGSILEPACGDGSMVKVLREYYPRARIGRFDLYPQSPGVPRVDFLKYRGSWDNVITNPPYNQFLQFLEHSLVVARDKVILLFPLTYLSGKGRYESIYSVNPPARIYVYSRRICLNTGDGAKNRIDFVWGVWEKGNNSSTLKWIYKEV